MILQSRGVNESRRPLLTLWRAENATTRSKVAATHLVTKTISKASECEQSKEKTLWEAAERNVFEMEEDDDKEDQGEVDEEEYCYEE